MARLGRTENKTRRKAKAMSEMWKMVFSRGVLALPIKVLGLWSGADFETQKLKI
jgi:hypothetical protein